MSEPWKIGQRLAKADGSGEHAWGGRPQAECEALGWTAVPEPAPVERKLADGWVKYESRPNYTECSAFACHSRSTFARSAEGAGRVCDQHAVERGAFAVAPKVEPPAPTEKAVRPLASGWTRVPAGNYACWHCRDSDDRPDVTFERRTASGRAWFCEPHAEGVGAFVGSATAPEKLCGEAWPGRGVSCSKPEHPGDNVHSGKDAAGVQFAWQTAKPAPVVEAPRCRLCGASEAVNRVMFYAGHSQTFRACDACYLKSERGVFVAQACKEDDGQPTPPRPPGLVPTSFGDERIGGVWASRGMR